MLYRTLSGPITAQVEITSACNQSCVYCYNHWRHGGITESRMSTQVMQATANQLIASKAFHVTFTGGEPFLNKDVLFQGIQALTAAGIESGVNSNMTLFERDDGLKLLDLGVAGILTSVCSNSAKTHDVIMKNQGSFLKVIASIKKAKQLGLTVAASMVVMKQNAADVFATGQMLFDLGVRQFFATKASPPLNSVNFEDHMISSQQLVEVLENLKQLQDKNDMEVGILECYPLCAYGEPDRYPFVANRRCSAGITTCTIGSTGDIRPCSHSDEAYGNVTTNGLEDAWQSMKAHRDGSRIPKKCHACSLLSRCSGGCRIDAKYCSGTYDALDPYAEPSRIEEIMQTCASIHLEALSNDSKFVVSDSVKTRNEEFGVLCASLSSVGTPAIIKHDTFDMLQGLRSQCFRISDVVNRTGLSHEACTALCQAMVRDKLLELVV